MATMSGIESFDESETEAPINSNNNLSSPTTSSQENSARKKSMKKKTREGSSRDEKIIELLKSMENKMDQKMTEMQEQIHELSAKRPRAAAPVTSNALRELVRGSYASGVEQGMSWHFGGKRRYTSQGNMELTQYIRKSVIGQTSDVPQTHIATATHRYFRSKRDEWKRDNEKHRNSSKLYQRRFQKARRRLRAIEMKDFSEEKKEKSRAAMVAAYMSSEDEEDGVRIVRPLAWESTKLRKLKKKLDKQYAISANKKSKVQLRERRQGEASARPAPEVPDKLSWILL